MKRLLFFFTLLMPAAACLAQSFSSLAVIVLEKTTRKPISNANFSIKEAGWTAKLTGNDGKVNFDKSVPIGEITYVVTANGYQGIEARFNITTEVKSNTLAVELTKTPLPAGDKVLIRGEITDKHNVDLEGALVEVKVGDIIKTATTDRSGNYFIEVELSKSAYQENMVRIEAKDRDCKKIESVNLPRTNVINKDFMLDCSNGNAGPNSGQDSEINPAWRKTQNTSTPAKKATESGVEVTVDKCEIVGHKLICHLTYRNVGNMPTIQLKLNSEFCTLTADNGNTYVSKLNSIGNVIGTTTGGYTEYDLIRGSIAKGKIEFEIGDTNFKKISRLQIGRYYLVHNLYDIPVSGN